MSTRMLHWLGVGTLRHARIGRQKHEDSPRAPVAHVHPVAVTPNCKPLQVTHV